MNPKTAATASIILFCAWVLFNIALVSMGLVKEPWHKPGLYSIGGLIFALFSAGLGLYARTRGKETLDPKSKGLALIPILGGGSFLMYFAMSYLGDHS